MHIPGYPFSLPGLVCVSPGTDTYHPATVLAISATVAPLLHVGARNALLRATEIDDPLDVFATHLVPGVVGLGWTPIQNSKNYVRAFKWNTPLSSKNTWSKIGCDN